MTELDQNVQALLDKGVTIHQPHGVEVAPDVDVERISGDGVVIHNGCRIRGANTVLSPGVVLGAEGPVTLEDCQLGRGVQLKGGYAAKSVFLAGATMGLGHHVREGSLLEEQSGGAHTVGLKQTILFPFVTLGSLINFCDAFMAGGTSRSDHSEVGSSYIHFNFTPTGDKTTPSMFGDVPRGVMLREKPIFLGGQGGAVGPVTVAYGTVVGAGSVVRSDILEEDQLHVVAPPGDIVRPLTAERYKKLGSIVAHNLTYLANLDALDAWYRQARAPFFAAEPFGDLVLEGALAALGSGRRERLSRLSKLMARLDPATDAHREVIEAMPRLAALFGHEQAPAPEGVLEPLVAHAQGDYLDAVKGLADDEAAACTSWLAGIVRDRQDAATKLVPSLTW